MFMWPYYKMFMWPYYTKAMILRRCQYT